jgi:outer membrane protein TolC
VAQSRQEAAEAKLELERLRLELRSRIERDASALRVARSGVDLVLKEEGFAAENAKVGRALLESGRIGPGEAAALEARLLERQADLVEARRVLFLRQVDLLRSTGSLPGLF